MKTFQQFKEEVKNKTFEPLEKFGRSFAKEGEKFVKSGKADELKNAAIKFMFNKFDDVVEKGNKKYNEIKSRVNK